MKLKIKCPHCKKIDNNPDYPAAIEKTKTYGEINCNIRCFQCKKVYSIELRIDIVPGKPKKLGTGAIPMIPILDRSMPIPSDFST